jgi:hypothetical protein
MMHQFPGHTREHTTAEGLDVRWQQGPIIGGQFNGASVEVVIRAAIARLEDFQRDEHTRCVENAAAIRHLNEALGDLDARTRDRYRRGVMGTEKP